MTLWYEVQTCIWLCQNLISPRQKELWDTTERLLTEKLSRRLYFRRVISTESCHLTSDDPSFPNDGKVEPPFVIADVPRLSLINEPQDPISCRWRQCVSFIEVKRKTEYSPSRAHLKGEKALKTLLQGADSARRVLAARPFNLFVYGLYISGDVFCVGYFDRWGIALSPDYNLTQEDGLRKFVYVVSRLLWDMSPTDLGQDPTVHLLPGHTYHGPVYPRYRVAMSTSEQARYWLTVGPPLWVPRSLLGRGTAVWRVTDPSDIAQKLLILRTSWRSESRDCERTACEFIRKRLHESDQACQMNIAAPSLDEAVRIDSNRLLTMTQLRGFESMCPDIKTGAADAVLHRVLIARPGKPLWEYSSIEQFVRALRSALLSKLTIREL